MNTERLLAHYDRIADAPEAVPRLRRFILELAVRGKLVEQDPDDEPASELLKQITAEKALLAKLDRTPKRLHRVVQIKRESLSFVPPPHWCWISLIDIARPTYGFAFPSERFNSKKKGMPLIRIRDISKTDTEAYFDGEYDSLHVVQTGDYLVGMDGQFNIYRWSGKDGLLNQRVMRIKCWSPHVSPDFVKLPLQFILDHLHGATSLTTVKHLSARQVNGIEVPLPPLAEQHRIVAKVDELMVLCDGLEAARSEREATRDRLAAAALARVNAPDPAVFRQHAVAVLDNLTPLTARGDQIKALRQTILNLAVQGRLVEQNPDDEPAAELLKRIAAEKARLVRAKEIKKPKVLPKISDLEHPIEIPSLWAWAQIDNLSPRSLTDGDWIETKDQSKDGRVRLIQLADVGEGRFLDKSARFVDEETEKKLNCTRLEIGDVLIARLPNPIGRACIFPDVGQPAITAVDIAILRLDANQNRDYCTLALNAPTTRSQVEAYGKGATRFRVSTGHLKGVLVPVPPLAEQRRIVSKVHELMSLCDRLEASVAAAGDTRCRLLEAVLHETLALTAGREVTP